MFRFNHAAAQERQQKSRSDASEKDIAPSIGADPVIDIGREQITESPARHHEAEDLGPVRLGERFGYDGIAIINSAPVPSPAIKRNRPSCQTSCENPCKAVNTL